MSTNGDVLSGCCKILQPSQWNLVKRLRLEALQESPQVFLGDYHKEKRRADNYWQSTFADGSWHAFFVTGSVPVLPEIVGIAKSSVISEFPEERYVESFWVRPDHRHQQVARRLLENIKREARREQRRVIRLSVLRKNEEAIKAFASLGLAETTLAGRSSTAEVCLELALA